MDHNFYDNFVESLFKKMSAKIRTTPFSNESEYILLMFQVLIFNCRLFVTDTITGEMPLHARFRRGIKHICKCL